MLCKDYYSMKRTAEQNGRTQNFVFCKKSKVSGREQGQSSSQDESQPVKEVLEPSAVRMGRSNPASCNLSSSFNLLFYHFNYATEEQHRV